MQTYFSSSPEVAEALNSPKLAFLKEDTGLSLVFIDPKRLHDWRRLLEEGLRRQGKKDVLYLNEDRDYSQLDSGSQQTGKKPPIPGLPAVPPRPLTKVRDKAGVLLLNTAQISSAYAEGDNNAMDKDGAKLRVICLCSMEDLHNGHLSDALIDRAGGSFADLRDFQDLPHFPDPEPKRKEELEDPYILDLQGRDDRWEDLLDGGLTFDDKQKLVLHPGHLKLAKGRPILLINPPENQPRLKDRVLISQNRTQKIYFAAAPNDDELIDGADNKDAAEDIEEILKDRTAQVHAVNPATLRKLIDEEFIFSDDRPKPLPSILEREKDAGHTPVLYVTESLETESDWHRLMQHEAAFKIAVAPDVRVPDIYENKVHRHEPSSEPIKADFFSHPVAFVKSIDPRMIDKLGLPLDVERIDIEPTDGADKLVSTLKPMEQPGCWKVEKQRLLQALIDGKKVLITGLENNPDVKRELDTLWQCGYLTHNGKRCHFGRDGGLTGSVLVLTDSDELIEACPNAPLHADPVGDMQQWTTLALQGLKDEKAFSHIPQQRLEEHLNRLQALRQIFVQQGLVAPDEPPFNYQELETLFRHTIDLPGFKQGHSLAALLARQNPLNPPTKEEWQRLLGAMLAKHSFEDQLIGKLPHKRPQFGSDEPEQMGSYLHICTRLLFPNQMECMPPRSVDIDRLKALLKDTHHEDAVLSNPWEFLSCFGAEVLQTAIGNTQQDIVNKLSNKRALEKEIGKAVLPLVVAVAKQYGIELQPWLEENADTLRAGGLAQSFDPATLHPYQDPLPTSPGWRNEYKARMLLRESNMLFLIGEPGAGKSYLSKKLTEEDPQFKGGTHYALRVADYGEAKFSRTIEEFMRKPGPATLLIEEVSLLDKHALNQLRAATLQLPPDKRIIVNGNDNDMEGRELPQLINDAMAVHRCEALSDEELYGIAVKCFDRMQSPPEPEEQKNITGVAIGLYHRMQTAFPQLEQSQRSLGEYMLQLVCVMDKKSLRTANETKPYINYIARQVYTNALLEAHRRNAELWLNTAFGPIQQDKIAEIAPIPKGLLGKDKVLADTRKVRRLVQSLCWRDKMLEWRESLPAPASGPTGLVALFQSGAPGIGKDKIDSETLKALGRPFKPFNAKASNPEDDEKAVCNAIEQKITLIMSEGNVHESRRLETWFNDELTKWPSGFRLDITANSDDTADRQPMSAAFLDRTMRSMLPDYDGEDWPGLAENFAAKNSPTAKLRRLSPQLGPLQVVSPQTESEQWEEKTGQALQLFSELRQELEEKHARRLPGARQMRDIFEDMAKNPVSRTVQQAVDRQCGIFRLLAEKAVASETQTEDEAEGYLRACKTILQLFNPKWRLYPRLRKLSDIDPDSMQPVNIFTIYKARNNTLYIATDLPLPQMAEHLRRNYSGSLISQDVARKKSKLRHVPPDETASRAPDMPMPNMPMQMDDEDDVKSMPDQIDDAEIELDAVAACDLPRLPLRELGLNYSQSSNRGRVQHTAHITDNIDYERYGNCEVNMFIKKQPAKKETMPKVLALKRLPESQGNHFPLTLALLALREQGVRSFHEGIELTSGDEMKNFFEDIKGKEKQADEKALWPQQEDIARLGKAHGINAQHIKVADARFYDKLVQHYYDTLFRHKIDIGNEAEVCKAVSLHWESAVPGVMGALPIELSFADKQWTITRHVFEEAMVSVSSGASSIGLLNILADSHNANIDMENSPILKELDRRMADPDELDDKELDDILKNAKDYLDSLIWLLNPNKNPRRLRQWAADKLEGLVKRELSLTPKDGRDLHKSLITYFSSLRNDQPGVRPEQGLLNALKHILSFDVKEDAEADNELLYELQMLGENFHELKVQLSALEAQLSDSQDYRMMSMLIKL